MSSAYHGNSVYPRIFLDIEINTCTVDGERRSNMDPSPNIHEYTQPKREKQAPPLRENVPPLHPPPRLSSRSGTNRLMLRSIISLNSNIGSACQRASADAVQ